ncbi:hypothetical 5-AMP-activated protein kinase, beta-1 subunit (AMPK beta-1 chain) (AMPKb) [Desulfobulbus propionicus DSM 2032]|jgi:hypothetical protein|uniref:Hypothetical 5-AMP-activated protein kinase, beta-1 subunit (AMPK beta-1 chain) (AMPKb) n=1 Tax=Desulfobulbus propionicus (strain ATCC 33891 / DSM 2032 / VKM B-1956 / 1pr3) TaxID=577650 RepID=A0A7U4DNR1_DESPD|nr:glycogen-binding domain-containing protein [Desulfobulbus propionicus]ADW17366.1 hypothetical 5-AMP-activated protein kinase, beta-1 subunit (AMPK beta-1 chain) (AMPKb) [Desulfobulbus propionicus DSM 2032]
MNDYLISLYIDNALDLDEKITFVETVHADRAFTEEAIALLRQEQRLRVVLPAPPLPVPTCAKTTEAEPRGWLSWLKPLAGVAAAGLLVALFALLRPEHPEHPIKVTEPHRFVVYFPDTTQARIVGTFTDWRPVVMEPVGTSGYWTLTLRVPPGEHRYSYLVGDGRKIADPTVVLREQDDFGGENSVIEIGASI